MAIEGVTIFARLVHLGINIITTELWEYSWNQCNSDIIPIIPREGLKSAKRKRLVYLSHEVQYLGIHLDPELHLVIAALILRGTEDLVSALSSRHLNVIAVINAQCVF